MLNTAEYKREHIIFTTIDIISESGIQAVSTREVARREGVSVGTIFHYFEKKDDLILAVLDRFCMYDNDIFNTIKQKKMKPEEAITFYLSTYSIYYENYPAIVSVYQAFDILWNKPEYDEKLRSIYYGRINFIKEMVEEAKKSGLVKTELDTDIVASLISSTIKGVYNEWQKNNYTYSLKDRMLRTVEVLLNL